MKYRITFSCTGTGHVTLETASEAEARDKFENGEWSEANRGRGGLTHAK